MKKCILMGMAVMGIAGAAGFSIVEVREYLTVARDHVANVVTEQIPLSVEIDRMEVLIKKLDSINGCLIE